MQFKFSSEYYKNFLRHFLASTFRFMNAHHIYNPNKPKINYIVEKADWSVRWDGNYISSNINKKFNGLAGLSTFPADIFNRVIHFGSHYMWLNWKDCKNSSNKYVVTYFHGNPSDSTIESRQVESFIDSSSSIDCIITAATLIENRLIEWGIEKKKIFKIPLGVDTTIFSPVSSEEKNKIRKKIGIPNNCTVIGSFQKDGVGWGDGVEPKLIKGPDIFIKTIKKLKNNFNIFVLLTGPSRGYVKHELEKLNVPYFHKHISYYPDLVDYYRVLDAYLVASREEGGPKAILESMASGIPIVSTNVGMAEDVIVNGKNGFIAPVGNYTKLSDILGEILVSDEIQHNLSAAALRTIKKYDWKIISEQYLKYVYTPLLNTF